MAELSTHRQDLIESLLTQIAECEGGTVTTTTAHNGDIYVTLVPGIPRALWCEDCKRKAARKARLMIRQSRPTKRRGA
jgi:hypothetical protein